MADIQIKVNNSTGLYEITLDQWEWTSLEVNATPVNAQPAGTNVQFHWIQQAAGPVHFVATASTSIVIVNAGDMLYLQSEHNERTFIAMISYAATPKQVTVKGMLVTIAPPFPMALAGPLPFSQGRMTGTFALAAPHPTA